MKMNIVAIALGSNLGDREASLKAAISRLPELGRLKAVSEFVTSLPMGCTDVQPDYLNAVVLMSVAKGPEALLDAVLAIEASLGRVRSGKRNEARVIDIDLLFYDNRRVQTDRLVLPHPRMHERLFVLRPLCQLYPDWVHPRLGRTAQDLFFAAR